MSGATAVVLDFDGVIVESVALKNRAFGELFRAEHPDKVDEILAFQLEHIGLSRLEKFPRIYQEILGIPFPEGELERLDREFSRIVFEGVATCPFVPGARELIERRSRETPLYVASATPQEEVRRLVERRGLGAWIRGVYGAPSPKPDALRRIAAETGAEPSRIVFVGDARNDQRAANEAGVRFVGRVPLGGETPFASGEDLRIVADLAELDDRWDELVAEMID